MYIIIYYNNKKYFMNKKVSKVPKDFWNSLHKELLRSAFHSLLKENIRWEVNSIMTFDWKWEIMQYYNTDIECCFNLRWFSIFKIINLKEFLWLNMIKLSVNDFTHITENISNAEAKIILPNNKELIWYVLKKEDELFFVIQKYQKITYFDNKRENKRLELMDLEEQKTIRNLSEIIPSENSFFIQWTFLDSVLFLKDIHNRGLSFYMNKEDFLKNVESILNKDILLTFKINGNDIRFIVDISNFTEINSKMHKDWSGIIKIWWKIIDIDEPQKFLEFLEGYTKSLRNHFLKWYPCQIDSYCKNNYQKCPCELVDLNKI